RLATGSAILAERVAKGDGFDLAFVNPSALLTQAYRGVGLFRAPLPVRIVVVYPSWDRFVFMVHPRTGICALKDIEAWGGRLVLCGGPSDVRRLAPLARGELDAVFDEGIKVWLDAALAAGLAPIDLEPAEFDAMARLGWRKVSLPQAR